MIIKANSQLIQGTAVRKRHRAPRTSARQLVHTPTSILSLTTFLKGRRHVRGHSTFGELSGIFATAAATGRLLHRCLGSKKPYSPWEIINTLFIEKSKAVPFTPYLTPTVPNSSAHRTSISQKNPVHLASNDQEATLKVHHPRQPFPALPGFPPLCAAVNFTSTDTLSRNPWP